MKSSTTYKNLFWFFLAAWGLLAAGFILRPQFEIIELILLLWLTLTGLFLIYRLNDFIDSQVDFKLNFANFMSDNWHKFFALQFVLVIIPLAFFYVSTFTFSVLGMAAIIGFLYSVKFNSGKKSFRIKNVFLLKNVLIGLVWGSLVLAGYGEFPNHEILLLFFFCSLQVTIGSLIRDLPDLTSDKNEGVNSLPVILGENVTVVILFILNASSIFIYSKEIFNQDIQWKIVYFVLPILVWRTINIAAISRKNYSAFWTQKFNLLTCVLIAVLQFIIQFYVR